jgi:hypothetical protein
MSFRYGSNKTTVQEVPEEQGIGCRLSLLTLLNYTLPVNFASADDAGEFPFFVVKIFLDPASADLFAGRSSGEHSTPPGHHRISFIILQLSAFSGKSGGERAFF